jgi:hypothetical protein
VLHEEAVMSTDRPEPPATHPGPNPGEMPDTGAPSPAPDEVREAVTQLPAAGPTAPQPGSLPFLATTGPQVSSSGSRMLPCRFGDYELLEEIGRGGVGVVYKARQVSLDRVVALKMLLSGAHAGDDERKRLQTEAEAIARLQHPNIIQIHEVGQRDGHAFFSLEYCAGGSLDQKLGGVPLPAKEAATLVEVLAGAMQAAHEVHVIHRDLKPGNVLLTVEGQPKITDFGLAKKLDDVGQTATGAVMGTPSYMAPEQARGLTREIGPATDVYALGAILYECLTGRPPFRAETNIDTLLQVMSVEPVRPTLVQPGIPRDVETICLKCLSKEQGKRYSSPRELADDLGRFVRGEPVKARPVGSIERAIRWARRRPAVAALLALVVVLLIGGTAGMTSLALLALERAKQANQALGKEKEAKQNAEQALDRMEQTQAQSFLRPLGYNWDALHPSELEALWNLSLCDNERVRSLFLEKALEKPDLAERLGRRGDWAMPAAVGLDPSRRKRLLRMLQRKFQDPATDPRIRANAALLAANLGPDDEIPLGEAAALVIDRMAMTADWAGPGAPEPLSEAIERLAGRMRPDEAALATRRALEAMAQTPHSGALAPLGESVVVLAARMKPDAAATAVAVALEVRAQTVQTMAPAGLAGLGGGAGVAGLVGLAGLGGVAGIGGQAGLTGMNFQGVGEPRRFPPGSAGIDGITGIGAVGGFGARAIPARNLVPDVTTRMQPRGATTIAAQLLEGMANTSSAEDLQILGNALEVLAAGMKPEEAKATTAKFLDLIPGREVNTWEPLARASAAVAVRMKAEDAAAAATRTLELLGKTQDYSAACGFGEVIAALATRMSREDAAAGAAASVGKMLQACANPADSDDRALLNKRVASLASRMRREDVVDKVRAALQAIPEAKDPQRWVPTQVILGLATRLNPEEAAAAGAAAMDSMAKTTDPLLLSALAEVLASVARRMNPEPSKAAMAAAVSRLLEVMRTTAQPGLGPLQQRVTAMATEMDPNEAVVAALKALEWMEKPGDQDRLAALGQCVGALAGRMRSEGGSQDIERVAQRALGFILRPTGKVPDGLWVAVEALATRLNQKQAAAAAAKVLMWLDSTNDIQRLSLVAALAARMKPEQGAAVAAAAVGHTLEKIAKMPNWSLEDQENARRELFAALVKSITQTDARAGARKVLDLMASTTDPQLLANLGLPLTILAARLNPEERATTLATAASKVQAMIAATKDDLEVPPLIHAMGSLVEHMTPQDGARFAAPTAARVLEMMSKVRDYDSLDSLGKDLAALAVGMSQERRATAASHAVRAILEAFPEPVGGDVPGVEAPPRTGLATLAAFLQSGEAATLTALALERRTKSSSPADLQLLDSAIGSLAEKATAQRLVDLLKLPTCVGNPRRIVLAELSKRLKHPFADVWELVAWLREHEPGLDLDSPPRRP